jgi:ketosteroid isomerase-like protein
MNIEEISKRLQQLEDIEEIRKLRFRYHKFVNDGPRDRFDELYTDDAIVNIGYLSHYNGREEIRAGFARMPDQLAMLKQFIHNHDINVDGESATGYAYFEAKYATFDEQSLVVAGRYDETYARTSAGWRISRTDVEVYFSVPLEKGWAKDRHFLTREGTAGADGRQDETAS